MSKNASVRVCVQRDRRCEHCTPDSEYKGTMNHSEDKWVKIKWSRSWSDFMPTVNVIFSSLLPRQCLPGWTRGGGEERLGSTSFSHSYSALYLTAIYVVNTDAPLARKLSPFTLPKKSNLVKSISAADHKLCLQVVQCVASVNGLQEPFEKLSAPVSLFEPATVSWDIRCDTSTVLLNPQSQMIIIVVCISRENRICQSKPVLHSSIKNVTFCSVNMHGNLKKKKTNNREVCQAAL